MATRSDERVRGHAENVQAVAKLSFTIASAIWWNACRIVLRQLCPCSYVPLCATNPPWPCTVTTSGVELLSSVMVRQCRVPMHFGYGNYVYLLAAGL